MPRKPKININEDFLPKFSKEDRVLPRSLRGMKDVLPSEAKYWFFVQKVFEETIQSYKYEKIITPILEQTSLFKRTVGGKTDIVEKEMFSFLTQGKEDVSLRPEATAAIVRAYIKHGMLNLSQPVKLYYLGPMFRYDRPQAGRLRQFNQIGLETIGSEHPVLDAQLILIANNFFKQIGVDINIQINSIGCKLCSSEYQGQLLKYYKPYKKALCDNCKNRMNKKPLRLLDCKEKICQEFKENAPQTVNFLCEDCQKHFMRVNEYLDELNIEYELNPCLVRGLDYYTRTVFEIWPRDKKKASQHALGGGGRYDDLIEMFGSKSTAACGFALGIERVISAIKANEIEIEEKIAPDIFLAQLGEQAKCKSLSLFEKLKQETDFTVAENFAKDSLKAQLEYANKLGVKITLILGQKELADKTILLREMDSGIQEIIDFKKLFPEIRKRLKQIDKDLKKK